VGHPQLGAQTRRWAVPVYPLYYNYEVRAHAAALRGPEAYAPGGEATWSVERWEIK